MISRRISTVLLIAAAAIFVVVAYAQIGDSKNGTISGGSTTKQSLGPTPSVSGGSVSGTILATQLAAYWRMDAFTGSTVVDETSTHEDLTIVGANVNISAGSGIFTNYVRSSSADSYLKHVDDTILGAGSGKSFSISMWYETQGIGANNFFVGKWDTTDVTKQDYYIGVSESNWLIFRVKNLAGTTVTVTNNCHVALAPSGFIPPNHPWVNICAGYDDVQQYIWIQVGNGPREITPCVGVRRTAADFTVCADSGGHTAPTIPFDEVAFWTRSISPQDVADLTHVNPATLNVTPGITYPLTVVTPSTLAQPVCSTNVSQWVASILQTSYDHSYGLWISNEVVRATANLWSNLVAAGITGKYKAVLPMPPSSTLGNQVFWSPMGGTPVYSTKGIPLGDTALWGSLGGFNPIPRNVTLNGIQGDGSSQYMPSPFNPSTDFASQTSLGQSVYVYSTGNDGSDGGSETGGALSVRMTVSNAGVYTFDNGAIGNTIGGTAGSTGYYSDNRVSGTNHKVYFANSGTPFAQFGSTDSTLWAGTYPNMAICVFAWNGAGQFTSDMISFYSLHDGFTAAEAQAEYNAVQAYRVAIGGGFR